MNQAITVGPDQIRMRDEWELKLKQDVCNLSDALFMCMSSGAPMTPYLIYRFEAAIDAYQDGEVSDLAEPFGIAMAKREKNAMERLTWVSHVRFHVDSFHEQGRPKNNPSQYEDTAFHAAAKLLNRSPTQIYDTYYE
jgi:hypothetical protein